MLNNEHYYHALLKKYTIYFGSLFNDIVVERTNEIGVVQQTITVPIAYGPKQKFIARLEEDPRAERNIAITLPRMSFEISSIQYDPTRKLNMLRKIVKTPRDNNSNEMNYTYTPAPYNITFSLSIYSKNTEDNLQVIEQILPYFTPEWTSSVTLIPEMNLSMDIPIILQNVNMTDRYEGPIENTRYIVNTLQFIMKAHLFGPVTNTGVIKRVYVNFGEMDGLVTDLYVTSNNNPAFLIGDIVYQTNGRKIVSRGEVNYSTEDYVRVGNTSGTFNTSNTLISVSSNRRASVTNVVANNILYEKVTITPGLTANGLPTSNSAASISPDLIKVTDDYGISIDIDEYTYE